MPFIPDSAIKPTPNFVPDRQATPAASTNPFQGLLNLIQQPSTLFTPTPQKQTQPVSGDTVAKMFGNKKPVVKNLPKTPVQNTQGQMGSTGNVHYQGLQDNLNAVGKLAKQVLFEAPARAAGGFALSATGQKQYDPNAKMDTTSSVLSKLAFGDQPVKDIQGQGEDYSALAKTLGLKSDIADKAGIPLAIGLGLSDMAPGIGGLKKKAAEEVVKTGSEANALAKAGLGKTTGEIPVQGATLTPKISTRDYLEQQKEAQEGARGKTSLKEKATGYLTSLKKAWVDSTSPIEDALSLGEKKGKYNVRPQNDVRLQLDRVAKAKSLASQFAEDNGLVEAVQDAPDLHAFNQYMIAKQAARVEELGKETGRNAAQDTQLVKDLSPTYEPLAQQVSTYSRKLLDYAVDSGLVKKEVANALKERYPDYVPLERIFSESEKLNQQLGGVTGAKSSLSKQTVVQNLEGSTREIENPLESLVKRTQTAFEQGEKNKAARMFASYKDLPGFEGLIKPLRTAENVNKRMDLYGEMKELKPIRDSLERTLQSNAKQVRTLQTEVNRLEAKGLKTSLKTTPDEVPTPLVSGYKVKNTPQEVKFGTGDERDVVVGGRTAKSEIIGDIPAVSTNRGEQSTKNFIEALITEPNRDITALKKQVATRENKLGPLLDHIQLLRDSFEGVKAKRQDLFNEARLLKDAESRGKSTFSSFKNGTKEIYETTPEIASAAKNLDQQQLNILTKILSAPTRLIQATATGLNVPFATTNLVKDQITSFVNTNKAVRSSMINPVNFMRALFSAVKHDDLYDEVIRHAGISTSYDISRKESDLTLKRFRANKNMASKIKYTATSPGEWLRTIENIVGRAEELTRIQQYRGSRTAYLKEGRTPKDARLLAAKNAREATANFSRSGDYGKLLNYVIPFFNASIQGTRSFVRAAQQRPIQTAAKVTTSLFLPMTAMTLWNTSDPERKKAYDDIPDYEKQNNLIFIPPNPTQDENGKWNVVKTPLPPGLSNLASIVRGFTEQTVGYDPVRAQDIMTNLIAAGTSLDVSSGDKILSALTPQAIKPFIETANNRNMFTGQDIVPYNMQDLPPESQVKENTSPLAIAIGDTMGWSPLLVENFIRTTTGGLGSQALGEDAGQQIIRRFSKATGGALEGKEFQVLQKYREQEALKTQAEKEQAVKVAGFLTDSGKSMDEKQQLVSFLKQDENKTLYTKVKQLVKDQSSDTTALDRAIKGLNSEQQAAYILDKLNAASPDEQQGILEQYKAKGLLTKSVLAEMRKQKVQPLTPRTSANPDATAGFVPDGSSESNGVGATSGFVPD